jgi:hypothetical protein
LELHKERATAFAMMLIMGDALPAIAVGVLSRYLRFIEKDNSFTNRCTTMEKWLAFLDGVKQTRLAQAIEKKTLEEKKRWVMRQVAHTLAAIHELDGDLGFFFDVFKNGSLRYSRELSDFIARYQYKECCEMLSA